MGGRTPTTVQCTAHTAPTPTAVFTTQSPSVMKLTTTIRLELIFTANISMKRFLLKVTPGNHKDRDNIREAQTRIESALEQINKDAKEIIAMKGSWRRGGQNNKKM